VPLKKQANSYENDNLITETEEYTATLPKAMKKKMRDKIDEFKMLEECSSNANQKKKK
jgi:hypothetical protein